MLVLRASYKEDNANAKKHARLYLLLELANYSTDTWQIQMFTNIRTAKQIEDRMPHINQYVLCTFY